MWIAYLFPVIFVSASATAVYERIGYFWHITDFHYDPNFSSQGNTKKGCSRSDNDGSIRNFRKPSGRFGDHNCDSPWELIESAAKLMTSRLGDNVEFVLWTGDALSHSVKHREEELQLEYMQNLTDLLRKTFNSQFVFPALGHDDPDSKKQLGSMWRLWLPTDSIKTFESGGYYMIERKTHKLQIVMLNTNLMTNVGRIEEANKQWDWLDGVLRNCEYRKHTVYIVGHAPPGCDERQRGVLEKSYTDYHNKRYLQVIRKHAGVIVGQFFGHLHSDTFRIVYDEESTPISWAMIAPSLTPRRMSNGQNNPGLRLYKFDKYTGEVLDYTQYYLDLSKANRDEAEWQVEYNFSQYYSITQITPKTLSNLAEKLTLTNDGQIFAKYYKANSVGYYNGNQVGCEDFNCVDSHYCAITKIDYSEFENCLKTVPSALASHSVLLKRTPLFVIYLNVFVLCFLW